MAPFQVTSVTKAIGPRHKKGAKAIRKKCFNTQGPKLQRRKNSSAFASTQCMRQPGRPPRRNCREGHPMGSGQDTQLERLAGPTFSRVSATHTFMNPQDSLSTRRQNGSSCPASLNSTTSRWFPGLGQQVSLFLI